MHPWKWQQEGLSSPSGLEIRGDFFVFPGVVLEIQEKGPQGRQAAAIKG